MRIMSPALPNLQALSLDFSPLGLRIATQQELQPGSHFSLTIDFDRAGMSPFEGRPLAWFGATSTRVITSPTWSFKT